MNRKQLNSLKDSLKEILSEENGYDWRAAAIKRNEEKRARKAESDSLNVMVRQEMANLRKPIQGANFDQNDQVGLRAAAIDRLSGNKEFVKRANAIGQTVGRYAGDGSAGRFGYRYTSQAEADAAGKESRDRLFDQEGTARIADTENKRYDPNTGKWTTPMVGKAGSEDVSVINQNGTIDSPSRYEELRQENIARNEQRAREAEEARKPKPREPFNYVNPNSPEGRYKVEAEAEAKAEANRAKVAAATEREEAIRAQARANMPAREEAYNKAVSRLKQMQQGQFGRPVPGGTERFYPPPSNPNQRQ
jgi:hypothetical protein